MGSGKGGTLKGGQGGLPPGPTNSFINAKNLYIYKLKFTKTVVTIKQHTLKDVNNCLNNPQTPGGQSSHLYLNVAHFFNTGVN